MGNRPKMGLLLILWILCHPQASARSLLGRWSWLVSGWAFNSGDFNDLDSLKLDDFKRPVNGAEEFWNSRHKLVDGCFIVLRVGELNDDTMEDHGRKGLSLARDGMFFMVVKLSVIRSV